MTGCAPPIVAGGSSQKHRSCFVPRPKFGLGGLGGGELWLSHGAKCSLCVGDQCTVKYSGLRGRGTQGGDSRCDYTIARIITYT